MQISTIVWTPELENNLNLDCLGNNRLIANIDRAKSGEILIYVLEKQFAFHDVVNRKLFFSIESSSSFVLECYKKLKGLDPLKMLELPSGSETALFEHSKGSIELKYTVLDLLYIESDFNDFSLSSEIETCRGSEFDKNGLEIIVKFAKSRMGKKISIEDAIDFTTSNNRDFYGLKIDGKIVSIAALTRISGKYRCLSFVYTDEKNRRLGYSRQLIGKLIYDALKVYRGLFLYVDRTNTEAIFLYNKIGFRKNGAFLQIEL